MQPLRLDDLGASSKQFERWSHHRWANIWPLHDRRLFGAWGPYRELTALELDEICRTVASAGRMITLAITPYWIDGRSRMIPYATKFPAQADVVRLWASSGHIHVAAHGLGHCIPGRHHPRWIGGNRVWHREPLQNPQEAMHQLDKSLGVLVTRYIPPGELAGTTKERIFHDREFVLNWQQTMRILVDALQ